MEYTNEFCVLKSADQFYGAPLGCGKKRNSNPGCAVNQFRSIRRYHNNSMNLDFKRVLPEYCQIHAKNLGNFKGKRESNLVWHWSRKMVKH